MRPIVTPTVEEYAIVVGIYDIRADDGMTQLRPLPMLETHRLHSGVTSKSLIPHAFIVADDLLAGDNDSCNKY